LLITSRPPGRWWACIRKGGRRKEELGVIPPSAFLLVSVV
jgi:hypothetical protein